MLAADLGGTQFRVALVDRAGRLVARHAIPTLGHLGPAVVLDRMAVACRDVLQRTPHGTSVLGLGICAPSPIDPKRGVVYQAPNLPGWFDIPLRDELQERLAMPVLAGNDANFAALGEWRFGAGRGHGDLVFLTFSTGVGSGFISGGRLVVGHRGMAGEAGHTVILAGGPLCACGKRGCLEALASGTAIHAETRRLLPLHPESELAQAGEPSAERVDEAATHGDALALQIMIQAGRWAGIGIANLMHVFDPDVFVLGGGVSTSGTYWWKAVRESAREHVLGAYVPNLTIVPAALGDDVGLYGAAAAMFDPAAAGA